MAQRQYLVTSVLLGALVFLGAGCGATNSPSAIPTAQATTSTPPKGAGQMTPQPPPPMTDEQTAQLKAGADVHKQSALTFNVVGGSFFYVPNEIRVKKGDKVTIIFTNAGGSHNLTLDEFGIKTDMLKTGESATVEFTADKTGSFEYYCNVGKHRQLGQKGTLVVE